MGLVHLEFVIVHLLLVGLTTIFVMPALLRPNFAKIVESTDQLSSIAVFHTVFSSGLTAVPSVTQ